MRTLKTYDRNKNSLTVMVLLAGAVSVHSQGYVSMNDYGATVGHFGQGLEIQIFQAQPLANSTTFVSTGSGANQSGYEEMGQPANSYLPQPGTTVYVNSPSTIGPGYSVGLLALDGGGATSYSQLSLALYPAITVVNTWYNNEFVSSLNNNYGIWQSSAVEVIPGNASIASVAVAVWQNTGTAGAASTLSAAQADGYGWGVSSIQTANLATGTQAPGFLPTTITSFSLVDPVPEPGPIALGLLGASALLFRRGKQAD